MRYMVRTYYQLIYLVYINLRKKYQRNYDVGNFLFLLCIFLKLPTDIADTNWALFWIPFFFFFNTNKISVSKYIVSFMQLPIIHRQRIKWNGVFHPFITDGWSIRNTHGGG